MKRFLVLGYGGSGGSTLAYMMDQLRSDLAAEGIDRIPAGWQFVHVDVPSGEEAGPDGLGNVERQGGRYIGLGPKAGSYADLDYTVSRRLASNRALDTVATWAPRNPSSIATPISVGAGQYRAVGRMITLSKVEQIRGELQDAWDDLHRNETHSEMSQVARQLNMGGYSQQEVPIVLVVSSMAGGAGASMALDVCRILTTIPGLDPKLMAVFMVSADIFDSLPESARSGVRSNALAMLGEIVSSQTGVAAAHDMRMLDALGATFGSIPEIPYARVFPVGRFVGSQRTMFGDGSPKAIYRGLARGLAGMMMSEEATGQFVSYDLGNTGSIPPDSRYLGWGARADALPWGSFGFASLSMGRDRYAEYAAQRIARSAVDQLLDGHLQEGNTASGTEQVNSLVQSQWRRTCAEFGIFEGAATKDFGPLANWLQAVALPRATVDKVGQGVVATYVVGQLPPPDGHEAQQWVPILSQVLASQRGALSEAATQQAYLWSFEFSKGLEHRTQNAVGQAIAQLGLTYAAAVLQRLEAHLKESVIPAAQELSRFDNTDIAQLPPEVTNAIAGMRGKIVNGGQIVDRISNALAENFRNHMYAKSSGRLAELLASYCTDVIGPMLDAINEQRRLLEQSRDSAVRHDGLARLATDQYNAWPSDQDVRAPERFDEANNEVLLTNSSQFLGQYVADLQAAVQTQTPGFPAARNAVTQRVVLGQWETTGGVQPPGGLVETTTGWQSRVFPTNPHSGESLVPSQARFDVHARPAELLERARLFVARPEQSFHRFCSLSLRDYVRGVGAMESERGQRVTDITDKFQQALTLALPLISANDALVQLLHGGHAAEYRYKFSAVPFANLSVSDDLLRVLINNPQIDQSSQDNYQRSVNDGDQLRRIDIFGSYPLYAPVCFDSMLRPVAEQWATTPPAARESFWANRRTRPLDAALPMGNAERQAMVAGWFLGQVVGALQIPEPPFDQPAKVFDLHERTWHAFPHPLLTPPERFKAPYDWLPAVMESILLAFSRSHERPVMGSMLSYHTLRSLFDASPHGPASGIVERSGTQLLLTWLRDGDIGSGTRSRVPGTADASSPEERAAAAKEFLTRIADLASVHFMAPGDRGAPGGGTFSVIDDRDTASQTPIFRDLAPDVFWATRELIGMVDEALARVNAPETQHYSTGAGQPEAKTINIPDGGVF